VGAAAERAGDEPTTSEKRSSTAGAARERTKRGRRSTGRRALLLSPGQLWGLRFMALGAVLVLAALIGGFVLLVGGDDDDDGDSAESIAERSGLTERVTKRDAGLSVFYPEDWRRTEREGIINLQSPDRCAAVALSAPVPADLSGRLLRDSAAGIRRSFSGAVVGTGRQRTPIGGAPTRIAVGVIRQRGLPGTVVRVAVSRGRELAHLVQQVVRDPERCTEGAEQARAIIDSIQYTR
jgi:hypothetical protein